MHLLIEMQGIRVWGMRVPVAPPHQKTLRRSSSARSWREQPHRHPLSGEIIVDLRAAEQQNSNRTAKELYSCSLVAEKSSRRAEQVEGAEVEGGRLAAAVAAAAA